MFFTPSMSPLSIREAPPAKRVRGPFRRLCLHLYFA